MMVYRSSRLGVFFCEMKWKIIVNYMVEKV